MESVEPRIVVINVPDTLKLGVKLEIIQKSPAKLMVTKINDNDRAHNLGFEVGDLITQIDGSVLPSADNGGGEIFAFLRENRPCDLSVERHDGVESGKKFITNVLMVVPASESQRVLDTVDAFVRKRKHLGEEIDESRHCKRARI